MRYREQRHRDKGSLGAFCQIPSPSVSTNHESTFWHYYSVLSKYAIICLEYKFCIWFFACSIMLLKLVYSAECISTLFFFIRECVWIIYIYYIFLLSVCLSIILCVWVWAHVCYAVHMKGRVQSEGVGSLLLQGTESKSWGLCDKCHYPEPTLWQP